MSKRLELLLQMLEQNPRDSFMLFALAKEHERLGDPAEALAFYERLQEADPGYVGLYYHLGKLFETLDRSEEALSTYRRGMEVARTAGDAHALGELREAFYQAGGDDDDDI